VELTHKQKEFNAAMELYHSRKIYKLITTIVSVANTILQIYLLSRLWLKPIGMLWQLIALLTAYVVTDFVNGLVHMYMDNNDNYDSLAGPLIANFHLHHKTPQYRRDYLPAIYFKESGSKIWLVGYLLAVVTGQAQYSLNPVALHILVYIGILSSVAEVSHYLCHSSTSRPVLFLEGIGVLLSKKRHAVHHTADNTNYTFLNGFTDPLVNLIARICCKGYKQGSDQHFAHYTGANSGNR